MRRVALPPRELHAAIVARVGRLHTGALARLVAEELILQLRRGEIHEIDIDGTSFTLAPEVGAERIGRVG